MHDYADNESSGSEDGDQRSEILHAVDFAEQEASDEQQEAIACIAHAHGEEQQEEDGNVRSRVEFVIVGPAVHVGKGLELFDELVVPELDGRIVLLGCNILDPEGFGRIEDLCQLGIAVSRCEAFIYRDVVLYCGLTREGGKVDVEFVGQRPLAVLQSGYFGLPVFQMLAVALNLLVLGLYHSFEFADGGEGGVHFGEGEA